MDVTRESSLGLSLEMLAHLPRVQEKSWDLCHLTLKAKHPGPRPRKQHIQLALSECVGVAQGRGGEIRATWNSRCGSIEHLEQRSAVRSRGLWAQIC